VITWTLFWCAFGWGWMYRPRVTTFYSLGGRPTQRQANKQSAQLINQHPHVTVCERVNPKAFNFNDETQATHKHARGAKHVHNQTRAHTANV